MTFRGVTKRPPSVTIHLIPCALLVLSACLLPAPLAAFSFTAPCGVGTTISPESPGATSAGGQPGSAGARCPTCCKQPLNLTFAGTPSLVYPRTPNVDKCIALCSAAAFYAVTADGTCQCFEACSEEEQEASSGPPTYAALGNVTACLAPCFPPQSTEPRCSCPAHAQCVPIPAAVSRPEGSSGASLYRCCCESLHSNPAVLPDNSTVCLSFALGHDLYGATNVASASFDALQEMFVK